MTRILKSLLGRKRKELSAEELEELNFAKMALQVRVDRIVRQMAPAGEYQQSLQ